MRSLRHSFAVLALLAVGGATVAAQSPNEILARYTRTIDPQGKIASIQGMKSTITMDIPAAGMTASIVAMQSRPNLMAMVIDIPGMGQMKQGYDGTTAWSSDPMQGPRLITGQEAAALVDGSDMNSMARKPEQFTHIEAAGEVDVDGVKANCLKLTWKSGRVTTECFSSASGLLVESRQTQQSQMGEVEAVTRLSDYRDVNGILVPHKMTQSAMGMQQMMTTTSVEFGPQDPKAFELPPEVKALKPE
ncbi:MAG: hypothetical protein KF709_11400 [Gemmatimonadaceae bacterium]|nr:hypothetical protein [Gemmatimonadaceae bacterium]